MVLFLTFRWFNYARNRPTSWLQFNFWSIQTIQFHLFQDIYQLTLFVCLYWCILGRFDSV